MSTAAHASSWTAAKRAYRSCAWSVTPLALSCLDQRARHQTRPTPLMRSRTSHAWIPLHLVVPRQLHFTAPPAQSRPHDRFAARSARTCAGFAPQQLHASELPATLPLVCLPVWACNCRSRQIAITVWQESATLSPEASVHTFGCKHAMGGQTCKSLRERKHTFPEHALAAADFGQPNRASSGLRTASAIEGP